MNFILYSVFYFFPDSSFAEDSKAIYHLYCSQCHGVNGNGKGINYPFLETGPRNHTDASYMSGRTDEQIEDVIRLGGIGVGKSSLMPAWGNNLHNKDIKALVKHLRKLCSCRFDATLSDPKLRNVDLQFRE